MSDGQNMEAVSFSSSEIVGGFWKDRQDVTEKVTLRAVYDRFEETGRFDALKLDWTEGKPRKPHIFWDSDVTKWIEGASYFLRRRRDPDIEERIDRLVKLMKDGQRGDGYLNSYFLTVEPDAVFTRRGDHELYSAGHLIEAAIAYDQATGKRDLLEVAIRFADLIDRVFRVEHSAAFDTPGHEEIELALAKLYVYTKEERYLKLAKYFIDTRGASVKDTASHADQSDIYVRSSYDQSHLPVREQTSAAGHCVRALYLYCGMADVGALTGDRDLLNACRSLFDDITRKKMYITGGIGSTWLGEAFTYDYDLPEYSAYNETCASIALAFFCRRMWLTDADAKYADCAEQAIYNTVLSGVSLGGDRFFYENPLSTDPDRVGFVASRPRNRKEHIPIPERAKVFDTSCCPPNLLRMIGSVADMMYSTDGDIIYAHCYMEADSRIELNGRTVSLSQRTEYPYDGKVTITTGTEGRFTLAVRIPGWCDLAVITVNGEDVTAALPVKRGYAFIERDWSAGDTLTIDMDMPIRLISANPAVTDACGRVAVTRGPLVYCAEGIDNPGRKLKAIRIKSKEGYEIFTATVVGKSMPAIRAAATYPLPFDGLYAVRTEAEEECELTLIPYFARANRGISEMTTWFLV